MRLGKRRKGDDTSSFQGPVQGSTHSDIQGGEYVEDEGLFSLGQGCPDLMGAYFDVGECSVHDEVFPGSLCVGSHCGGFSGGRAACEEYHVFNRRAAYRSVEKLVNQKFCRGVDAGRVAGSICLGPAVILAKFFCHIDIDHDRLGVSVGHVAMLVLIGQFVEREEDCAGESQANFLLRQIARNGVALPWPTKNSYPDVSDNKHREHGVIYI